MEFYRQLVYELDIHIKTNSKAMMLRIIKKGQQRIGIRSAAD